MSGPGVGAIGVTVATSGVAGAEEAATKRYAEALRDYDGGRFEKALEGFRAAYAGSESPNARLYIARCLVALERYAEGYRELSATVALAREKARTEERYVPTRDAAAAELAVLEPKVGKVIVVLSEEVAGATLSLDDEALPRNAWGKPYAVAPGALVVIASAPGHTRQEKSVQVAGGETQTVAVSLIATGSDVGPEGGGSETAASPGIGPVRATGIALAALGVGGLVSFAVTGSMAQSRFDEVSDACGGVTCPDDGQNDTIDEGKRFQTIANVSLGVGLGLAAGGALMIIFGGDADDPDGAGDDEVAMSFSATPLLDGGGYAHLKLSF
ncbi:MAG: hypothetical protein AAF928_20035 [Myxococcota bacterium]